jgi:hypothetical protein
MQTLENVQDNYLQISKKVENALHSAKSSEHYTPQNIIELSREVLGTIDLDPFSCEFANTRVKAERYFRVDGLDEDWLKVPLYQGIYNLKDASTWKPASVFLNPPSKLYPLNAKGRRVEKSGAKTAWNKLMAEIELNHVSHAIVIAYSLEQLQITQKGCKKAMADFPFCIASERFDYVNQQGEPQTNGSHSSAIIYVPNLIDNSHKFKELFSSVGKVLNV